jgi:hypothetical protein
MFEILWEFLACLVTWDIWYIHITVAIREKKAVRIADMKSSTIVFYVTKLMKIYSLQALFHIARYRAWVSFVLTFIWGGKFPNFFIQLCPWDFLWGRKKSKREQFKFAMRMNYSFGIALQVDSSNLKLFPLLIIIKWNKRTFWTKVHFCYAMKIIAKASQQKPTTILRASVNSESSFSQYFPSTTVVTMRERRA